MTLLEVIIALLILGIIMGPLTMSFIQGLKGTRAAERLLGENRSAQQIASLWTRDVQDVEPRGVNTQEACPPSSPSGLPEEQLITFSWGAATSSGGPRSASWVVVGTGYNAKLERRACALDQPTDQQVVADSFGLSQEDPSTVIRGPLPTDSRQFCPLDGGVGRSCTIVVAGKYDYSLSVDRRVPDTTGAVTPDSPPRAPSITIAEPRRERINVGWAPPTLLPTQSAVIGYRLHLYDSAGGEPIDTIDLTSTSHSFTGLTNGSSYWVRVQARNAAGWGPLSLPTGPIVPSNSSPEAPAVVSVTPGDTSVSVSWTPNSNNGGSAVQQWRIYAETLAGGEAVNVVVPAAGGGTETGDLPGLLNGQTYKISVAGINALGEGPRSARSSEVVPYGVPGTATIYELTPLSDGSIRLRWNEPTTIPANAIATNGGRAITGYRVRAVQGSPAGPWPASGLLAETAREYVVSGLTQGVNYSFVVETHNLRGNSTSPASANGLSATPPGLPRDVTATQSGTGNISLSWTPPLSNGGSAITGYVVRRNGGGTVNLAAGVTTHTFTGLGSGSSYTFYVRAVNAVGQGPEESQTQIALGAPGAGTLAVVRQPGSTYPFAVNTTWTAPTNRGGGCIKAYRVEYSPDQSLISSAQTLTSTPGAAPGCSSEPATSAVFTGLTAGVQTRYFRLVTTNTADLASTSAWVPISLTQVCTITAVEDTYIDEFNGGLFSSSRRGNNYGNGTEMLTSKNGSRVLMKFDPRPTGSTCAEFSAALPTGRGVTAAAILVRKNSNDGISGGRAIQMFRAGKAWSETSVTYNSYSNATGSWEYNQTATVNAGSNGTVYAWWVNAADVVDQANGNNRNGWLMRDDGSFNVSNIFTFFRSRTGGSEPPRLQTTFY